MLTNLTLDILRDLGLSGMASAFQELDQQPEAQSLQHGEWLTLLLEREMTTRRQKRFEARARGVRAMVPHVDELRAVHNLEAIGDLAHALGSGRARDADPRRYL